MESDIIQNLIRRIDALIYLAPEEKEEIRQSIMANQATIVKEPSIFEGFLIDLEKINKDTVSTLNSLLPNKSSVADVSDNQFHQ